MPNFLCELFVEEIPHTVIPDIISYMHTNLPLFITKFGLTYAHINYFITPRRISFFIEDLPMKSKEIYKEQKGPAVKFSYDEEGKPTKVLEGFLNSYHVTENDIEERDIKGQKYLFIHKKEQGEDLYSVLPRMLSELIQGMSFSLPMHWNYNGKTYQFIRPVRGLTILLDQNILPFELFGIVANNKLFGHRQLFPEPFSLNCADDYEKTLQQHRCIVSFELRKSKIELMSIKLAESVKGFPLLDDELLNTLASLTEYPEPLLGEFGRSFLTLPKEVLISEMKIHQKYIPIVDSEGELLPYYIITANIPCEDEETKQNILLGNSRVLYARFVDAIFFFDEDLKKGLDFYTENLASVAFLEGAGSLLEKVQRMTKIALYLKEKLSIHVDENDLVQAIKYAKADLNSLMVGEFPELQGIIGSYYGKKEGLNEAVILAIKEHYYPKIVDGEQIMPSQELSALVALADRLDNLLTLHILGRTVTGSRDPYSLRRQTIAIIHIIIEFDWNQFSLKEILKDLYSTYEFMIPIIIQNMIKGSQPTEEIMSEEKWNRVLLEFVQTRLEGILKQLPYEYATSTINAVFGKGIDFLLDDIKRVEALEKIRSHNPTKLITLIELSKRIAHIIKDQIIKEFREDFLEEEAEKFLYERYKNIIQEIANLSYYEQLMKLIEIESAITNFFSSIMVKTGDEKEVNRISLLSKIHILFNQYADFSKL